MLNWRYGTAYTSTDIGFELCDDFNAGPMGADWLRLASEWYEKGLIPRSVWLIMLKQNDVLSSDYNDEEGKVEITEDDLVFTSKENMDYAMKKNEEQSALAAGQPNEPLVA